MAPGTAGVPGLTVMVIGELVAVELVTQSSLDVITTVITSLFARLLVVNTGLLVPTFDPFFFHW